MREISLLRANAEGKNLRPLWDFKILSLSLFFHFNFQSKQPLVCLCNMKLDMSAPTSDHLGAMFMIVGKVT